jgi:cob(I)alamin adenosyltransferase
VVVRIDRVVTRGGDGGETSLGDGTRVQKDVLRVEAYGTVDEANATIGLLRLHVGGDPAVDAVLARVQNDLFDIGADLCVPGRDGDRLRVGAGMADAYDNAVAAFNEGIPELRSFVLPGGTAGSAAAHLARTVVRRAERRVVALSHMEAVNPEVVRALNRLSDLLFVVSRRLNANGAADVLWHPGGAR